jgi:hypothetical protein
VIEIEVLVGKFDGPIGQVFAVKYGNPFFLMGSFGTSTRVAPYKQ